MPLRSNYRTGNAKPVLAGASLMFCSDMSVFSTSQMFAVVYTAVASHCFATMCKHPGWRTPNMNLSIPFKLQYS